MKEPEYVYILTNPSFKEDWVKIGKSSRPVNVRSKDVDKGKYTYAYPKATLKAQTLTSPKGGSDYHVEDLTGISYTAIFDGDIMTLYWGEDAATTMTRSK